MNIVNRISFLIDKLVVLTINEKKIEKEINEKDRAICKKISNMAPFVR